MKLLIIRTVFVELSLPLVDAAAQTVRVYLQQEGPNLLSIEEGLEPFLPPAGKQEADVLQLTLFCLA